METKVREWSGRSGRSKAMTTEVESRPSQSPICFSKFLITMPPARKAPQSNRTKIAAAPPPASEVVSSKRRAVEQESADEEEWDHDGDDQEDEFGEPEPGPSKATRASNRSTSAAKSAPASAASSRPRAKVASSSKLHSNAKQRNEDLDLMSDEEDILNDDPKTVSSLKQRIKVLEEENSNLADQFDQLKSLRHTSVEEELAAQQKAFDSKHKSAKATIDALRTELQQHDGASNNHKKDPDDSSAENNRLKSDVDRLRRERNKANEEAARLEQELRTLRKQQQQQHAKPLSEQRLRDVDKESIRQLYEDLTGIQIQSVVVCEKDPGEEEDIERRRFKAFFSASGHYDLFMEFEESLSTIPPTDHSSHEQIRQDLVFTPKIDLKVDRDLLENSSLPRHFREGMRFDRTSSVKFLGGLTRGLRK
ncbi:unnamed protein product [Sympodiomycopsis kandeliae]